MRADISIAFILQCGASAVTRYRQGGTQEEFSSKRNLSSPETPSHALFLPLKRRMLKQIKSKTQTQMLPTKSGGKSTVTSLKLYSIPSPISIVTRMYSSTSTKYSFQNLLRVLFTSYLLVIFISFQLQGGIQNL